MKNKQLAELLAPRIKNDNLASVTSYLGQIIRGEKLLPAFWEPHLLSVLGLKERDDLRTLYPHMKLREQSKLKIPYLLSSSICKIELVISNNTVAVVSAEQISSAMHAMEVLNALGFGTELKLYSITEKEGQ